MSFLRRLFGRDDEVAGNGLPAVPQSAPRPTAAVQHQPIETPPPVVPGAPADSGSVFLADVGPKKIHVIKVVREASGLGLREAKDLVEAAPTVIVTGLSAEAAAALRHKLEAAGARVG
jgi:large subunit ribosomal protein L7/L12